MHAYFLGFLFFFRENKETQELNVLPMSIKWAGCLHSSFDKSGGETVLNYWMGDLSPSLPEWNCFPLAIPIATINTRSHQVDCECWKGP